MFGIVLIDFKKMEDSGNLGRLPSNYAHTFDKWVKSITDETPTKEECTELEQAKIDELLEAFDAETSEMSRVQDEVPDARVELVTHLERRRGKLFNKFSDEIGALTDLAADCIGFCVDYLTGSVKRIKKSLPVPEDYISGALSELNSNCADYIATTFPGGVDGLDSYDDELPDGFPSYSEFKEQVAAAEVELAEENLSMVEAGVEEVKAGAVAMAKNKINEAIKTAMNEIKDDLSDDVLPYLDSDTMESLREELLTTCADYGASRLDEE